jgi:hypothetical protein
MKVNEILIGLEQDGYQWTAKNPKQTLYVRVGKLTGVRKIGEGLYSAEGSSLGGIAAETRRPLRRLPSDRVSEVYQRRNSLLLRGSLPQFSQRAGHPDLHFCLASLPFPQ